VNSFFVFKKENDVRFLYERVYGMPLDSHYQMQLLKDILSNHQTDCCGSVSECEQVERLVKSLMVNADINENIKPVLQEIYQYSQSGAGSSDLGSHITSNRQNLSQWVTDMDQFS
jgi:hypothetical protein